MQNARVKAENAWQGEAVVTITNNDSLGIHHWNQVAGAAPSYNNICDIDRGLQTLTHISTAVSGKYRKANDFVTCIGVKHGNACAAGVGATRNIAAGRMALGDPTSLFGGTVLMTGTCTEYVAAAILEKASLLDVVVAGTITGPAQALLARKGGRCKMFEIAALTAGCREVDLLDQNARLRYVRGGYVTSNNYTYAPSLSDARLQEQVAHVPSHVVDDLLLAWAIGSTSTSNTITIVRDGMLLANAVGQQSRVRACKLALMVAEECGHDLHGSIAYSDSFIPFPDGLEVLAKAGVKTIFASNGSVRDGEVRAAAEQHGVTLITLPDAECRGFYGH